VGRTPLRGSIRCRHESEDMKLLAESLAWLWQVGDHMTGKHMTLVWSLAAVSICLTLGGIVLARWLVVAMPADYFLHPLPLAWEVRHPVGRWVLLVGKNVLGVVLAVAGVMMLVTPGPGIVTLLAAVILLDFPGKRALEQRFLALPAVLATINKMRQRANRPPLEMPRP
jgi:hypothetical protein